LETLLNRRQKSQRSFPHKVVPLLAGPNYANILRVVGQALEILEVTEYDLRILGNDWLVHAYFLPGKLTALNRNAKWVAGASRYRSEPNHKETSVDFRFTPAQISQLAQEFTRKRGIPNLASDIFGTAELLRVVGHHLDLQKVYLLGIFRRDQFLTLRYENAHGENRQEFFQTSFFYRLFVTMYVKRRSRVVPARLN
jgi:hypothetical protein